MHTLNQCHFPLLKTFADFESGQVFTTMDAETVKLLEQIVIQYAEGHPLTVSQAMMLSRIASPSSLHKKIEKLRKANLISHEYNAANRRTKYLMPSSLIQHQFHQLERELKKIALSQGEFRSSTQ